MAAQASKGRHERPTISYTDPHYLKGGDGGENELIAMRSSAGAKPVALENWIVFVPAWSWTETTVLVGKLKLLPFKFSCTPGPSFTFNV